MLDEDSSILLGMGVGLLQGQFLHVGQGLLVIPLHLHHDGQVQVVLPVLAGQGQGVPEDTLVTDVQILFSYMYEKSNTILSHLQ